MISITIHKNDREKPIGVRISGHSGYADKGKDIICAAVSILVINTVNSIETFTKDVLQCDTDEKTGTIDFQIISDLSGETELLIRSLLLGLNGIRNEYGETYLKMEQTD